MAKTRGLARKGVCPECGRCISYRERWAEAPGADEPLVKFSSHRKEQYGPECPGGGVLLPFPSTEVKESV